MVDIIVKDKEKSRQAGYKQFIGEVSKGSARPAFCNPGGIKKLKETIDDMKENLEVGNVSPEQRMKYKMNLKKHEDRLTDINDEKEMGLKIIKENPEYWVKRRDQLEKEIRAETPTRKDVKDKLVNPHTAYRKEMEGLRDKKLEFQIISPLLNEDSDISYLQRR